MLYIEKSAIEYKEEIRVKCALTKRVVSPVAAEPSLFFLEFKNTIYLAFKTSRGNMFNLFFPYF